MKELTQHCTSAYIWINQELMHGSCLWTSLLLSIQSSQHCSSPNEASSPFLTLSVSGSDSQRMTQTAERTTGAPLHTLYPECEPDVPLEYEMNHERRGCALIFNQENVKNNKPRRGTNKDRDSLSKSFQALGFEVKPHNDKSKKAVLEVLHKAAQADHTETDCFVCVFLTHGKEGHIYASDDAIKIKEITDLFRGDQCKSLVGKPKIFIFQACAGKKREDAVTGMMAGDNDEEEEEEEEAANIYTIPAGADFLMCYSVAEGFRSFRSAKFGSYYIQDLCEMLQKHGSTREFTELLTQVNLKVSQRDMHPKGEDKGKKQMPCFTSMLTKRLYFRPKNQ